MTSHNFQEGGSSGKLPQSARVEITVSLVRSALATLELCVVRESLVVDEANESYFASACSYLLLALQQQQHFINQARISGAAHLFQVWNNALSNESSGLTACRMLVKRISGYFSGELSAETILYDELLVKSFFGELVAAARAWSEKERESAMLRLSYELENPDLYSAQKTALATEYQGLLSRYLLVVKGVLPLESLEALTADICRTLPESSEPAAGSLLVKLALHVEGQFSFSFYHRLLLGLQSLLWKRASLAQHLQELSMRCELGG